MSTPVTTEVGRFYTRARKVKKMLGRLHDGSKIWGGPYTLTQGGVGVVSGFVILNTNWLWTTGMAIVDIILGGLVVWGLAWFTGRLPSTNRNPALVMVDASGAVFRPATGSYRGESLSIREPRPRPAPRLRPLPETEFIEIAEPIPPTPVEPESQAPVGPPDPLPMSGSAVQRLLAQVNTK
ncbi:hypothetical protein DM794_06320 [Paenarthrobacter ureafaciens]|uniref:hypothetical protein n=1 Tax=Paenarthrobacter TaxID=1742992 RepID=UPI0015C18D51|nr:MULTISPECIES: hypothetical protein [Paenarthrobacter]NWL10354.1 hypothetical protein [Paenarthrobacter nitroguajacolicus]NWL26677.1 hypothetical protein [Paenarthrobacter ureafaciens]NWL32053.1 hypothetical protein [Paenarthrobacter nitroguajacolicus]